MEKGSLYSTCISSCYNYKYPQCLSKCQSTVRLLISSESALWSTTVPARTSHLHTAPGNKNKGQSACIDGDESDHQGRRMVNNEGLERNGLEGRTT